MASAFDCVDTFDAEHIRKALWAGQTMAAIRREYPGLDGDSSISARQMRAMRDELFEPLIADPDALRAVANGPCINPLAMNFPKRAATRFSRTARQVSRPVQVEMFPA